MKNYPKVWRDDVYMCVLPIDLVKPTAKIARKKYNWVFRCEENKYVDPIIVSHTINGSRVFKLFDSANYPNFISRSKLISYAEFLIRLYQTSHPYGITAMDIFRQPLQRYESREWRNFRSWKKALKKDGKI